MRTAAQDKIQKLYHYETFHPERLHDILSNNRVWVSSPADFNDPWDFKFDYDVASLADPTIVEKEVRGYIDVTYQRMRGMPLKEIFARAKQYRDDPKMLAERAQEAAVVITLQAQNQYRVYCTASRWDCQLMWAHYGGKHTGICLEYATDNPVFSAAMAVEYRDDYPNFRLFAKDDVADTDVERAFTAKSSAWAYEREYRVVAQERAHATAHPTLVAEGNYLAIPRESLTAIVVGCAANADTVRGVARLLVETKHPAVMRRLERSKSKYELVAREQHLPRNLISARTFAE